MKIIYKRKEKPQPKTKRVLKVSQRPQGKKYAPGINLQGKYLNEFGFFIDDLLVVNFQQNKIIISKIGG